MLLEPNLTASNDAALVLGGLTIFGLLANTGHGADPHESVRVPAGHKNQGTHAVSQAVLLALPGDHERRALFRAIWCRR
jgi:hypothetical protein